MSSAERWAVLGLGAANLFGIWVAVRVSDCRARRVARAGHRLLTRQSPNNTGQQVPYRRSAVLRLRTGGAIGGWRRR